ncbi:MAG: hypothetical protein ABL929_01410 [Ferruginibacter sp.]|nr:hypothetical protein [Ferruginibacter sp.]
MPIKVLLPKGCCGLSVVHTNAIAYLYVRYSKGGSANADFMYLVESPKIFVIR